MIQTLLWIIKIIGIIAAVLLSVFLLLLCIVLFVPFCYGIRLVKEPEMQEISGTVSFLSPLIRFRFRYAQKKFTYQVKTFWHVFTDSEKKNVKNKEKKNKAANRKKKSPDKRTVTEKGKTASKTPVKKEASGKENKAKTSKKERAEKEKKNIPEKLRQLLQKKEALVSVLEEPESKRAIAFAWDKLKRILRHILPKKIKGYVIYGNADPAVTGKVFGAIAAVYAATGPVLKAMPDFEQERLECNVEFRGRLRVATFLILLLKIYFHQELRQMIQRVKAITEIE